MGWGGDGIALGRHVLCPYRRERGLFGLPNTAAATKALA